MKRLTLLSALLAFALSANAQMFDFAANTRRLEAGFTAGVTTGDSGSFQADDARFGFGAYLLASGFYLDFIRSDAQHRYYNTIENVQWEDTRSFSINAGYQIPILPWLRIMPVIGYAQNNHGITDGTRMKADTSDDTTTWYHPYSVDPESRQHHFNYGGGLSIQPCKWFSINAIATRRALYGGIGIDILSIAGVR